ncbi:hypothetical protein [Pseudonocardia sp. T1-2H]|uniref:hypothetical protein n=1 Tax=Pseudonocardia sp. T1-2H TaxID=3128899 RepID=UPI0031018448
MLEGIGSNSNGARERSASASGQLRAVGTGVVPSSARRGVWRGPRTGAGAGPLDFTVRQKPALGRSAGTGTGVGLTPTQRRQPPGRTSMRACATPATSSVLHALAAARAAAPAALDRVRLIFGARDTAPRSGCPGEAQLRSAVLGVVMVRLRQGDGHA